MKKYILILLCIMLVFTLGGCNDAKSDEVVEITLMHGWGGNLQTHKIMQEIYAEFNEENPDIKLNCISYSSNTVAVNKANDMLAVGKVVDVLSTNGLSFYVNNAVKTNVALDLMDYIEKDEEWKSQIHPAVFDTWETKDHKLYTIPDAMEVAGYWYNEKYLKSAGIVDENGNVALPKTWDDFIEIAEKLQAWIDETGQDISVFAIEKEQLIEFLFFARLAGGSEEGLRVAQNPSGNLDEELLKAVLDDLEQLYLFSDDVNNIEDVRQSFINEKTVIYFNGVWEADALSKSEYSESFSYANYPTYNGKSLAYISPSSGYVLAKQTDSRKAEACVRFLKYMLSEEVQKKLVLETGQASSNPNVYNEEIMGENALLGEALDMANNADIQIATIRSIWSETQMNTIYEYLIEWEKNIGYKK